MILSHTIIVVEDSETERILFSKYLDQMGYQSVCYNRAQTLLDNIDTLKPSIILMDIEMPGISGIEAGIIIRKHQEKSGIKHNVIAITGHTDNNLPEIILAAGFDDYLTKPIRKKLLESTLSRYLDIKPEVSTATSETETVKVMEKLYNLDMFEEDDPEFIQSMVELFISNTPKAMAAIKLAFEQNEMEVLRQHAHKLKPHFSFFGAPKLQQTLQIIEDIANGAKSNEKLFELIESVDNSSILMIEQMRSDFYK